MPNKKNLCVFIDEELAREFRVKLAKNGHTARETIELFIQGYVNAKWEGKNEKPRKV